MRFHDKCILRSGSRVGFAFSLFHGTRSISSFFLELCSFLARYGHLHWNFQFSPRIFYWFHCIHHLPEMNGSQSSGVDECWHVDRPFLLVFLLGSLCQSCTALRIAHSLASVGEKNVALTVFFELVDIFVKSHGTRRAGFS